MPDAATRQRWADAGWPRNLPAITRLPFDANVGIVFLLGLALPVAYALFESFAWPLIHDAPIMHYIAWRISEGAVPYRDIFDMNQPGAYLVHLAVLRVLGESDAAWRMFDLVVLAWTALVIRRFAAPWGIAASVGASLFFVAFHLMGGAWHMGERNFLLCPLLLTGGLAVAVWDEAAGGARRISPLVQAGAAVGAAITIKPHTLLFALAMGVLVVLRARRRGDRPWMPAGVYLAALVAPCIATMAWLANAGGMGAWWWIMRDYVVPLYSHVGRAQSWPLLRSPLWASIGLTIAVSLFSIVRDRRFTARHGIAIAGVIYGVAHYFGQGKAWPYHLYPLAAFAALLLFAELGPAARDVRARRILVLVGIGAAIVFLTVQLSQTIRSASVWDKEAIIRQAVDDVAARTRPGDTAQVLDTAEGGLHALLRLHIRQPSRFVYDFHFVHDVDSPTIQRLRAELMAALRREMPRVIVVFRDGWPSGGYDRVRAFPALSNYIDAHYAIAEQRRWYTVLERRASVDQRRPEG